MRRIVTLSLVLLLGANFLMAQTNNKLRVEGTAKIKAVPEDIIVSVDLTVKDSLYQVCFNRAMESLQHLKTIFKKNGIDPEFVKSKHIRVNENFEWHKNERVKTGYIAHLALEVKNTFTQKFSASLLKSLDRDDLNVNYRIAFAFSDEQKDRLQQKVIALAVADAQQKAETIAQAANVKIMKVAAIHYGNPGNTPQPLFYKADQESDRMVSSGARNFAGVELNPKEQELRETIVMEWLFGN
ncbi:MULTISPECIES: SIMPL domain-containing protein [unclassified Carboxylicivirga]|uniref:SIMPL domain-containing protein n=1 Tax=Carboxylicivirga TaxID=1628153 RepID=UPI003D34B1CD